MATTLDPNDRAKLREFLEQQFSLDELKTLAFDLGVSYDKLPHATRPQLSRELISYFERTGNLNCLITRALSQRHDDALAQLSAKLPPCVPRTKVQIIIAQDVVKDLGEIIADLAAKLNIDVNQVELIRAAWGSLYLLVSLPKDAADALVASKVRKLVNGKYKVRSITAYESLGKARQKAWQELVRNPSWQRVPWSSVPQSGILRFEGIGPVFAQRLKEAGIRSTEALLAAGATPQGRKDIAAKAGIADSLMLSWVNRVDLSRIKGVGEEYSDLLAAAGVDTVVELAQRQPANLYAKLIEVNQAKKRVRKLPTQAQIEGWIKQAKKLPRKISY